MQNSESALLNQKSECGKKSPASHVFPTRAWRQVATAEGGQYEQCMAHDTQRSIFLDGVDRARSLLFRRELLSDSLTAETLWLHTFNRGDGLIWPKRSYERRDNVVMWLGMDVFYGTRTGLFGEFDQNDRVVIGIEWGI